MLKPEIQDKRRWWSREDLILLILLGILYFLPGLAQIPLFDRDEPRFATAAREMANSGDYIVPHFNGNLRPDKPPLLYWLMNASYALTGGPSELGARLPSALCGTLTLLVVYFAVGSRFGRVTGLIASLMLGSTALFIVESRLATADSTMLLFITICMACAWQAWDAATPSSAIPRQLPRADNLNDAHQRHIALDSVVYSHPTHVPFWIALLFWLSLALGTLTKGVPLFFVIFPMLVLSVFTKNWSWWRHLRPLLGVPLLIVLVGWWVIAAGILTDWRLIQDMVGVHFLNRTLGPLLNFLNIHIADPAGPVGNDPMKSYGKPPGFYLLLVWVTFWPWSLLLVPAAFHALRRLRGRTAVAIDPRPYQFLIAWIIPTWIVLELARGKLLHYPLPTYVPLIILCADALVQAWHRMTDVLASRWFAAMRWIFMLIWIALGLLALIAAQRYLDPDLFSRCIPLAGALVGVGVASAIAWGRPSWPFVIVLGFGAALLILYTLILPEISPIRVSKVLGQRMAEVHKAQPEYHFAFAGYEEPTVVFYAGAHVDSWATPDDLIAHVGFAPLTSPKTPYLVIVDQQWLDALNARHVTYYPMRVIKGFNPANFKPVTAILLANIPPNDYSRSATAPATTSAPASLPANP